MPCLSSPAFTAGSCHDLHDSTVVLVLLHIRYFDPETVGLDFEGMKADLEALPNGSVVVLHGKHNLACFRTRMFCCVHTAKASKSTQGLNKEYGC